MEPRPASPVKSLPLRSILPIFRLPSAAVWLPALFPCSSSLFPIGAPHVAHVLDSFV